MNKNCSNISGVFTAQRCNAKSHIPSISADLCAAGVNVAVEELSTCGLRLIIQLPGLGETHQLSSVHPATYPAHKPCSNFIPHTNHAQTVWCTQTMLKLYPAHKLCSNCIQHTNYAQTVSCTQTTLRLYPAHKPHSNFNLHTNHTQTVSCKQTMLKLYLAYKPCSNCILQINHAQSPPVSCVQTKLKLYLAYKPCSNRFSLHFIKLFFFTELFVSPKYSKFFLSPK